MEIETHRSVRPLLISGAIAMTIALLTYYFNDGKVSSVWLLYIEGVIGGLVIAWIATNFLLPLGKPALWKSLASVLIGGFIGMGLGQILRFLLVSVPYLSALRHEAIETPIEFYIISFSGNLQNAYSLLYLAFLTFGTFIGMIRIRRILNIVVKWAIDYKQ